MQMRVTNISQICIRDLITYLVVISNETKANTCHACSDHQKKHQPAQQTASRQRRAQSALHRKGKRQKSSSLAGNRTRISRVRILYPKSLSYVLLITKEYIESASTTNSVPRREAVWEKGKKIKPTITQTINNICNIYKIYTIKKT